MKPPMKNDMLIERKNGSRRLKIGCRGTAAYLLFSLGGKRKYSKKQTVNTANPKQRKTAPMGYS
jgi:hypothetical protein